MNIPELVPQDALPPPNPKGQGIFRVLWSNGAGETIYRVRENPASDEEIKERGELPHIFEVVSETEYV